MAPKERSRPVRRGGFQKNIAPSDIRILTLRPDDSMRQAASVALTRMLQPRRRNPRAESFALTRAELRREVDRCRADGWQPWEIAARFTNPNRIPDEGWAA